MVDARRLWRNLSSLVSFSTSCSFSWRCDRSSAVWDDEGADGGLPADPDDDEDAGGAKNWAGGGVAVCERVWP